MYIIKDSIYITFYFIYFKYKYWHDITLQYIFDIYYKIYDEFLYIIIILDNNICIYV